MTVHTGWLAVPDPEPAKRPLSPFGEALDRHLASHRLSQAGIARRIECSSSYINRMLNGSRAPSKEMIEAIVDALALEEQDALRLAILALMPERYQSALIEALDAVALVDVMSQAFAKQQERRVA